MAAFFYPVEISLTPCTPSRGICGAHVGTGCLRQLGKGSAGCLMAAFLFIGSRQTSRSCACSCSCKTSATYICLRDACKATYCGHFNMIWRTGHTYPLQNIFQTVLVWPVNCRNYFQQIIHPTLIELFRTEHQMTSM